MRKLTVLLLLAFLTFGITACGKKTNAATTGSKESSYTVSYESNGGSSVANSIANKNNSFIVTEPTEPTKEGYEFVGWYSDLEMTNVWSFQTIITKDITLYAKWDVLFFLVSFSGNLDEPITAQNLAYGSLVTKPDVVREGFQINNWYTESSLTNVWDFETSKVTKNITLYPEWGRARYTISFDTVGATSSNHTTSLSVEKSIKPENIIVPSKTGFAFIGYFDQEIGGTKYYDAYGKPTVNDISQTITLYARWNENILTVSLNNQGATSSWTSSAVVAYGYDTITRIINPIRTGYQFVGWYTSSGNTGDLVIDKDGVLQPNTSYTDELGCWNIEASKTLYAHWQNEKYKVTLDNNEATTTGSTEVDVTYYNQTLPFITNPLKEGNAFLGWYINDELIIDYNGQFLANTSCTDSYGRWKLTMGKTITAKWGEATYTITLNSNGATSSPTTEIEVNLGGGLLTTIVKPTKSYYTFDGWFTALGEKIISQTGVLLPETTYVSADGNWIYGSDVELVAQWRAARYQITLSNTHATIAGSTFTIVEYGGKTVTEIVNPIRYGYIFTGWFTSTSGGVLVINPAGELQPNASSYTDADGNWKYAGTRTLNAQWTPNTNSTEITFDDLEATVPGTTSLTATNNALLGEITNPSKEGFVFFGWKDENGALVIDNLGKTLPNTIYANSSSKWHYGKETLTLYAYYIDGILDITLDSDNGVASTTVNVAKNGGLLESITIPTKTGYDFIGWYLEDELIINANNELLDSTTCVNENGQWISEEVDTLVAKWEAKKITVNLNSSAATIPGTVAITVTYGSNEVEEIINPSTKGKTFLGWYKNNSKDYQIIDAEGNLIANTSYTDALGNWTYVSTLVTLYAQYENDQYIITLDNNSATTLGYSQAKIRYSESILVFTGSGNPIKEGYVFMGWYSDQDELIIKVDTTLNPSTYYTDIYGKYILPRGCTLTAKWSKIHTISFDNNGATTNGYSSATITQDSSILNFVGDGNPVKTNNIFIGWYLEDELIIDKDGNLLSNTTCCSNGKYTYGDNVTLVAKWQALGNITLTSEEGSLVTSSAQVALNTRAITEIENPIYNGHAFMGWYLNDEKIIAIDGSLCPNTSCTDENGNWTKTTNVTLVAAYIEATPGLTYTPITNEAAETIGYSVDGSNLADTDTSVVIPDYYEGLPITKLLKNAFTKTTITQLYVPYTVTEMASGALSGCSNIEDLTIPFVGQMRKNSGDTYQYQLGYVFAGITANYTRISASYQNGTSVSSMSYYIPNSLSSITITDSSYLPRGSFQNLGKVKSISLNNKITNTGSYIFYYCSDLTEANLPYSITELKEYSFNRCTSLEEIVLPNSIRTIGKYAFDYCSKLLKVDMPIELREIKQNAFSNCSLLAEVIIKENVHTIEENAFYSCRSISIVKVDSIAQWAGIDFANYNSTPLNYAANIKLYSYNASQGDYQEVVDLVIPEGLTTIKQYAFYNAQLINSVTFPSSIKSIGLKAFANCKGITYVSVLDVNQWASIRFADETANPLYYAKAKILKVYNEEANIYVPIDEVVFSDELEYIAPFSFYFCSNITKVVIPDSVIELGKYCFSDCPNLKTVSWNYDASVKYIGEYAFQRNTFTNIIIPNNVESIGNSAFHNCVSLNSVYVNDVDNFSMIKFGNEGSNPLYYYNGDNNIKMRYLYLYDAEKETSSSLYDVVLSENNDYLSPYAFINSAIRSITIPDKITEIGQSTFKYCKSLKTVTLGENSQLQYIGNSAFYYCTTLEGIALSNSVRIIDDYAFFYCTALKNIALPSALEKLGGQAFNNCRSLLSVVIPEKVTLINSSTFSGCSSLESVTFDENNKATSINAYAFQNCSSLKEIVLPDTITSIGNSVFYGDSKLETVILSDSLLTIGDSAFYNCQILSSIDIPDNTTAIYSYAFGSCASLKEVIIPKGLSYIGNYVFENCSNLSKITFEEGSTLKIIYQNTFRNCNLKEIELPYGLTNIYGLAFENNYNLVKVTIPVTVTSIATNAFSGCYKLILVENHSNMALTNCGLPENTDLEENVLLEGTITSDDKGIVFYEVEDAKYIIGYYGEDEVLDLSSYSDVTAIYSHAFRNCTSIKKVIIPNNIENIGAGAFNGCYNIEEMVLPYVGASRYATNEKGLFGYIFGNEIFNNARSANQRYASSNSIAYYIPSSLSKVTIANAEMLSYGAFSALYGLKEINLNAEITEIGEYAFANCSLLQSIDLSALSISEIKAYTFNASGLEEIILPESVTMIGNYAFSNCKIKAMDLSNLNLIEVGDNAFQYCSYMETITLPNSLEKLSMNMFYNCTELTNIVLPENLKEISNYAFYCCSSLENITLPDSVEKLGENCLYNTKIKEITIPALVKVIPYNTFYDCVELEKVLFQDGTALEEIGGYAFADCDKLKTIVIPEGVKKIGYDAFYGCTVLKTINLPESLETIENYAFYYCVSLQEVSIPSKIETIDNGTFSYCVNLTSITIPNTVTSVSSSAFENCYKLVQIRNLSTADLSSLSMPANKGLEIKGASEVFSNTLSVVNDLQLFKDNTANITYVLGYVGDETALDLTGVEATMIYPYAFYSQTQLKSLVVPNTITWIGNAMVAGCYNLESLTLPFVGSNVNANMTTDAVFSHIFGYVYYNNNYSLYNTYSQYYAKTSYGGSYGNSAYVPVSLNNVTITDALVLPFGAFSYMSISNISVNCFVISEWAFYRCHTSSSYGYEYLESVNIGPNVRTINVEAFYQCYGLKEVNFAENSSLEVIEARAFYQCFRPDYYAYNSDAIYETSSIVIPSSVKMIGDYAFYECYFLNNVTFEENSSLQIIGSYAFYRCTNTYNYGENYKVYGISELVIPASVVRIGQYAFAYLYNLGSLSFEENSSLLYIDDYAFYCSSNYSYGDGFAFFRGPKSLEIPKSVLRIGEYAFYSWYLLNSLTFEENSSLEIIDNYAFYCCTIYYKNDEGIINANGIKEVTIPASVKNIGSYAFAYNYFLEKVVFAENSVLEEIGENAFVNCCSEYDEVLYGLEEVVLPDGPVKIGNYAFAYNRLLNTINLGDEIEIGYNSFINCPNIMSVAEGGINYLVDENGTKIGAISVSDKTLTEYTIDDNVAFIEKEIFAECTNVIKITVPYIGASNSLEDGNDSTLGYFFGTKYLPNTVFLSQFSRGGGTYYGKYIPRSLNEVVVTKATNISYGALSDCRYITKLTLPNSVVEVGGKAFEGSGITNIFTTQNGIVYVGNASNPYLAAYELSNRYLGTYTINSSTVCLSNDLFSQITNLKSITIPNSVKVISPYAFNYCTSLESITLSNKLITIGDFAFNSCSSLKQINLPNSLKNIGIYAFASSGLTSIVIPASVEEVGIYAFSYCEQLASASITDNSALTKISDSTFIYCQALASFNFGNSSLIQTIGQNAFRNSKLSSIVIPKSVTEIRSNAFAYCYYLETVSFEEGSKLNKIESYAFYSDSALTSFALASFEDDWGYYSSYSNTVVTVLIATTATEFATQIKSKSSYFFIKL